MINKIRFIYEEKDNPIREYLRVFFEYIGLLTCEERINFNNYKELTNSFSKENDEDGFDIIINFSDDNGWKYEHIKNRLYLYVDMENNICGVTELPCSKFIKFLEFLPVEFKNSSSKRETRIGILDLLINQIWKNDEENKNAINEIREYYVPNDEDRDLFYLLEAFEFKQLLKNSNVVREYNASPHIRKKIYDDTYKESSKLFIEFYNEMYKMCCLLNDSPSPYSRYAFINSAQKFTLTYNILDKFFFSNEEAMAEYFKLNIKTCYVPVYRSEFLSLINKLIGDNPKFIRARHLLHELSNDKTKYLSRIFEEAEKSNFPEYYSNFYALDSINKIMDIYWLYIEEGKKNDKYINEILDIYLEFKERFKCDVLNQVLYAAVYNTVREKPEKVLRIITRGYFSLNITDVEYSSFRELIYMFEFSKLLIKIYINAFHEHTARQNFCNMVEFMNGIADSYFIQKIADVDEEVAFKTFESQFRKSYDVLCLCKLTEDMFNVVSLGTQEKYLAENVRKRLSGELYEERAKILTRILSMHKHENSKGSSNDSSENDS